MRLAEIRVRNIMKDNKNENPSQNQENVQLEENRESAIEKNNMKKDGPKFSPVNKIRQFFSQYPKKTRVQMVCLVVAFLVSLCAAAAIFVQTSIPHQITDPTELAERTTKDLKLFEFQLENENYQIPSAFSDFQENGWVLDSDPILNLGETRALAAKKDNLTVYLNICNQSTGPINASACEVVQITVKAAENEVDTPVFFGKDGLCMRMSYDQMKDILGKYNTAEKLQDTYTYTYYYGETAAIRTTIDATKGLTEITLNRSY